jgi:hypothetical protein
LAWRHAKPRAASRPRHQEQADLIRDFAKGDDGFLSLSRSTVIGAPEEIARAYARREERVRNGSILLSTQSSTVTRAMKTSNVGCSRNRR